MRFHFDFDPAYRVLALPFGITPANSHVEIALDRLTVRYGPWRLRTTLDNVAEVSRTGGYALLKTAGPPHLSFADRGVTFASNGREGVCLRFHRRVKGIDPTGVITHPGATFTVADPDAFEAAVRV